MKTFCAIIFALMFAGFGCKGDNPTQPIQTIEERINAAKPITNISIFYGTDFGESFYSNGGYLKDAYAEKGYFIVKDYTTHYYNLGLTKEVEITEHKVTLTF
jgi:hypothetical protein